MSWNHDYIVDQIEKVCQLIVALISSKKFDKQEAQIDQTLSEMLGLDVTSLNDASLSLFLKLIEDDNKKVLIACLLKLKDERSYTHLFEQTLAEVDVDKLDSRIKRFL